MLAKKVRLHDLPDEEQVLTPTYGQRLLHQSLPRYDLPEGEMSPQTAYNVIRDELMLDGNARLNLATFVTTWMEPEARLLMAETFDAFALKEVTNFTVFDLSERLRDRGWLVPAYTFPKNREDLAVLRIVVKEGFSRDMANLLLNDIHRHLQFFTSQPGHRPGRSRPNFSHH